MAIADRRSVATRPEPAHAGCWLPRHLAMNCRHCHAPLQHVFLDLGSAPPSNAYLNAADLNAPERYFPLRLRVCTRCWLVQTEDYAQTNELFDREYAYFSSVSQSWLDHAARYAAMIRARLGLDAHN